VIIDDCSHIGALSRISFWHLFERHLKRGGIYAIEDWGTGYWNSWPDGASVNLVSNGTVEGGHTAGMVGFIKELIDEAGAGDITHPRFGTGSPRASRFREMRLSHGHVLIIKS
jgi:hypothetical protein